MNKLTITFVNVGYGEAALIECPDASAQDGMFRMLIDGGSAEDSEYAETASGRVRLRDYLHSHPVSHIDILVNTHIHEDHTSGLPGITPVPAAMWQTFPADFGLHIPKLATETPTLSLSKFLKSLNDYRELCEMIVRAGGIIEEKYAGAPASLCEGLSVQILSPNRAGAEELTKKLAAACAQTDRETMLAELYKLDVSMNNRSLILMFTYGKTKILLPGDTNAGGYGLITEDLHADLWKVGHHGQKDAVTESLTDRISPAHIVCCASSDRRYNSAEPGVMNMLRSRGIHLWFSDCPEGQHVQPHSALKLTVGTDGDIAGKYLD